MNFKIIGIGYVLFFLFSCSNKKEESSTLELASTQVDSLPGNSPYLTKDTKGNVVMSWARSINDTVGIFCYSVSKDSGRTFGKIITIPESNNIQPHSENLPKIVFKPSGEIIALWGEGNPNPNNKYSGVIYYSQSFDEGATWSKSKPLVTDTLGYDQRYFDVDLLPSGEVAIIWLDNRKHTEDEGSAIYYATTAGREGFQNEKIISESCCQCCRTDLFVDSDAGIHVLYRGIIMDSIRDMLHISSTDGGKTFSDPKLISTDNWVIKGCPHTGPSMTENSEGLHFAWFTGASKKGCFYTRTNDNGNNFIEHDRVSALGSHPQIASFTNGNLIIAWDEDAKVNNRYYKRIGIQKRTTTGNVEMEQYITVDTLTSSYPVVACINENVSVIAHLQKRGQSQYVMFQRLVIK
jgi:hypothetical protein